MKIGPSERALRMLEDLSAGTTPREVFVAGYHAGAAETLIRIVEILSADHPAAAAEVAVIGMKHAMAMMENPCEVIDSRCWVVRDSESMSEIMAAWAPKEKP